MTLHARTPPESESVHVRHVHGCHVTCMRGADIRVPPWEVPAPTPRMPDHEACCHHPYPLGGAADSEERSLMWVRIRRIVEMDEAGQLTPNQSVSPCAPTRRRDRRVRPPLRGWTALRPQPTRRLQAHPSTPPGVLVATCPYQGTQSTPRAPAHRGGLHATHTPQRVRAKGGRGVGTRKSSWRVRTYRTQGRERG